MSTSNSTQLCYHGTLFISNENSRENHMQQQACCLPLRRRLPTRNGSSSILKTPRDKISRVDNFNVVPQVKKNSFSHNKTEEKEEDNNGLPNYLFLSSWTETVSEKNSIGIRSRVSLSFRPEKLCCTPNQIPRKFMEIQPNNKIDIVL